MTKLLYQGHAAFRITTNNNIVIYIDPYLGEGYDKKADIILVTHQHHDHNQINLPFSDDNTVIYQNYDALKNGIYVHTNIKGIDIEATEAYNKNHKKEECVGYILSFDNLRLYFLGDTSTTNQMKNIKNIDYAFLPCDGIFNMDANEATKCANIINAKHSVPIHTYPEHLFSDEIANSFNGTNRLIIHPGEEIEL